jgi:hypothetical protein
VIREPPTRKTTIGLELHMHRALLQLGGIFAGSTKVNMPFLWTKRSSGRGYLDSGYDVVQDSIQWADTFGAKAKLTLELGRFRWFAQAQFRGLVSDGGPDWSITLTDWTVKMGGRGNQLAAETGATVDIGSVQIAPKILYQHPLIGPNPKIDDYYSPQTGLYYPAVRPRNVLTDPFAVRENRETVAAELLLVYDPTPITWYWSWDREMREDAPFAASLDAVYRVQPTSQDSGIFILANGTLVAAGAAPPAHDVWDVTARFIANPARRLRIGGMLYAAQKQTTGSDARLVTAAGGEIKLWWRTWLWRNLLRFYDWGPYDYQRDFNLTFPVQFYTDLSYGVSSLLPSWLGSRVGVRAQVRTLDKNSENYVPDIAHSNATGLEWEIGAYVHLSL